MKKNMKPAVFTLILLLTAAAVSGQTERAIDKTVAESFERHYNSENDDAIFDSFSTEMQKALPLEQTRDVLTNLRSQAGKIVRREFVRNHFTAAV
jgi:hypothetical protein